MAELKDKAKKFFRRSSTHQQLPTATAPTQSRARNSSSPRKSPSPKHLRPSWSRTTSHTGVVQSSTSDEPLDDRPATSEQPNNPSTPLTDDQQIAPILTLQEPSPDRTEPPLRSTGEALASKSHPLAPPTPDSSPPSPRSQPQHTHSDHTSRGNVAVDTPPATIPDTLPKETRAVDYFSSLVVPQKRMIKRKIWIKRAGASPTLVHITDEDLVDDVRDMVLRKYANSLGRTWDAPDVTIRIAPRERSQSERILGPDEPICSILDAYYPGGQSVDEALLIDVPRKRTPQPSPRLAHPHGLYEDNRPMENGNDYFPPMPATSPHTSHSGGDSRQSLHQPTLHSISVLETGQLPALPSPNPRERKVAHHRPKAYRQHTSSPTLLTTATNVTNPQHNGPRQQYGRMNSDTMHLGQRSSMPPAPPLPTPPVHDAINAMSSKATSPALETIASPRPPKKKARGKSSISMGDPRRFEQDRRPSHPQVKAMSTIEATVPPINVLIVEDNPINLRLLEMFTKRLKVRWSSVMNGRDAVLKWRTGGFHLVLMDIQLPIMSGLEATKEIRRLERVNGIGVFARVDDGDVTTKKVVDGENSGVGGREEVEGDDKLSSDGLFKSPVIIVALTASSLQSDRHEALAAGCNDFLTKPVYFPWLERKVMEWGCMQALVDFDGWRKWKDLAAAAEEQQQKDEDLDPAAKAKREKREAKRAATLARMGAR